MVVAPPAVSVELLGLLVAEELGEDRVEPEVSLELVAPELPGVLPVDPVP